jgi:hypothetical protein
MTCRIEGPMVSSGPLAAYEQLTYSTSGLCKFWILIKYLVLFLALKLFPFKSLFLHELMLLTDIIIFFTNELYAMLQKKGIKLFFYRLCKICYVLSPKIVNQQTVAKYSYIFVLNWRAAHHSNERNIVLWLRRGISGAQGRCISTEEIRIMILTLMDKCISCGPFQPLSSTFNDLFCFPLFV